MVRTLDYGTYFDKVYGGWVGKCIGGAIGAQVEGQKRLHNFTEDNAFPEKWPPNDDLDLQVLWLHALRKRGIFIESKDLAEEWIEHCWYSMCEYGRFIKNFLRGIEPPISGWFDNEFFKESMGCPIRSEIWGFICPGNPGLAAWYAKKDGVLDHWKNSVWAEQFLSAIEASLFFESDILRLINIGLSYIPENSEIYKLISLVIRCREEKLDWITTRKIILSKYGNPDFTSVFQNIGFTLMALLWGEYDFSKTMLIALNSGYDTDCTCATAGAILGAILGEKKIPRKWREPIGDIFEMGFPLERESFKISDLARETCEVGIAISRVLNKEVHIVNVPKEILQRAFSIPIGKPFSKIKLSIDYLGLPSIGKGEEKRIRVIVENESNDYVIGKLRIKVPNGWSVTGGFNVLLSPKQTLSYDFIVKSPSSGILWDRNILKVIFEEESGKLWEKSFGLCGAKLWRIIGPFWDGITFVEDRADIDKEYVNESLILEGKWNELFKDSIEMSSYESTLPLNQIFPLKGEYCVYLLHRFISPNERKASLVVGSNGDFKIWFNGILLGEGRGKYIWNPVMYRFETNIKKGENIVIIKYVKKTERAMLSFDIYKENVAKIPGYSVWQIDFGSLL